MAAQLQQPADPFVEVPPPPQNPPTLEDVYNAHDVVGNVLISSQQHIGHLSTHDDVSRALMYEHTVTHLAAVEANQVMAPGWLGPLQNQLNAMQQNQQQTLAQLQQMQQVQQQMQRQMQENQDEVLTRFDDVGEQMIDADRRIIRLMNGTRHNGATIPYVIVPFTNGDDPTQPPHNLEPLVSASVINRLSALRCNEYLQGYEVDSPPGAGHVALRRQLLKRAIGAPI